MTEPMPLMVDATGDDRTLLAGALHRSAAACIFAACITLAACAHYVAKPLPPAASAEAFTARSLTASSVRDAIEAAMPGSTTAWPPPRWDRAMLLLVAIAQNPELRVARAEAAETLARKISAAETPNPTLTLQSEYARDEVHPWLYGFALDALLRTPSRKRLDIDIAARAGDVARWKVVDSTWQVRAALIAALSDWHFANVRAAQLDRLVAAQRDALALQQRRIDAGEDAAADRVVLRQGLLDAQQQRAGANSDIVSAQSALAAVLGMPPAALDGVTIDWTDWGSPPAADEHALQADSERALLSRADLAAALAAYAATEKQLERAIARQYPQFHLDPGYYWDHGVAKWPLDLAFEPALFNRNQGEIAEASSAREAAGARMLAVQAGIIGAIDAARRAERVAATNVDDAEQRAAVAHGQVTRDEYTVRLGASDRRDVLAASAVAARSDLDVIEARVAWQRARNALEDALHAPLSGPELRLRSELDADAPVRALAEGPP